MDEKGQVTLGCIEIEWDGPFTMDQVGGLNKSSDCGVYQIYGTHTIFGPDSLLYIGKAHESFANRIPAHQEWIDWESKPVSIFVGRLGGTYGIDDETWNRLIDRAERLLIYYTSPPYNSTNLRHYGDIKSAIVINHNKRHRLPLVVTTLENESQIGSPLWKVFGQE